MVCADVLCGLALGELESFPHTFSHEIHALQPRKLAPIEAFPILGTARSSFLGIRLLNRRLPRRNALSSGRSAVVCDRFCGGGHRLSSGRIWSSKTNGFLEARIFVLARALCAWTYSDGHLFLNSGFLAFLGAVEAHQDYRFSVANLNGCRVWKRLFVCLAYEPTTDFWLVPTDHCTGHDASHGVWHTQLSLR